MHNGVVHQLLDKMGNSTFREDNEQHTKRLLNILVKRKIILHNDNDFKATFLTGETGKILFFYFKLFQDNYFESSFFYLRYFIYHYISINFQINYASLFNIIMYLCCFVFYEHFGLKFSFFDILDLYPMQCLMYDVFSYVQKLNQ